MRLYPITEIERGYFGIPEYKPNGLEMFCVLLGFAFIATMVWVVLAIGILLASVMGFVGGLRRFWMIGR